MALPTRSPYPTSASTAFVKRERPLTRIRLPSRLSAALVPLILIASVAGVFVPGLYRDAPNWTAQTRGTDLVTLAVAVPALAVSLVLARRGSLRATIVWLGVLGYALYMYVIYAFDVAFNPLFLVYVASLALSLWSLVALLVQTDPDDLRRHFAPSFPVRAIALYLLAVAALFFLAWMSQIVPAVLGNTEPTGLRSLRLPTNPVHVLDLSIFLPLTALSGIWLWQRRSWGYVLAGVILTTTAIVGTSIVSDSLFERAHDATTSLAVVPLFGTITLAGVWFLGSYLWNLRQNPDPDQADSADLGQRPPDGRTAP